MLRIKPGSLLIELLIYIAVSLGMYTVLFNLVAQSYKHQRLLTQMATEQAAVFSALTVIEREIRQASPERSSWLLSDQEFSWLDGSVKKGFLHTTKNLYFVDGSYKNILLQNIESFTIDLEMQRGFVKKATVILKVGKTSYKQVVFLMNGFYV